ncbi:MAG: phospholipase [Bacteroidaceae bacterium]|nr:phospholipase [Bacteroidaceae bacterium]
MLILYAVGAIALLGIIAALAHWVRGKRYERMLRRGEISPEEIPQEVNPVDMECCGAHEVCEKDSLLAALSKQIEYYNDEELDRFRGREGDEYTSEEADEFRDVLYTMRSDEVAGWVRSLQLRMVNLPDEVKDEVFLIVGERRVSHTQ